MFIELQLSSMLCLSVSNDLVSWFTDGTSLYTTVYLAVLDVFAVVSLIFEINNSMFHL